ncbi:ATP-binding protein [Robinsoniella peoriensis]
MIKRIRGSLTLKIFLITSLILICVCGVTYGFIAYFMPQTYTYGISEDMDKKMDALVADLENTKFEDSGPLFDDFIVNNTVDLQLLDSSGKEIQRPGSVQSGFVENVEKQAMLSITVNEADQSSVDKADGIAVEAMPTSDEDSKALNTVDTIEQGDQSAVLEGSSLYYTNALAARADIHGLYGFIKDPVNISVMTSSASVDYGMQKKVTFSGSNQEYELYVLGAYRFVNQAVEAMNKILPWLMVVIVFISTLTAYLYSRYITRPVVRLSKISKKMSGLEFNWICDERRNDEIGVLSASLNELSQKLSTALSELKSANESLQKDIETERKLEQKRLEFFSAVSHELKTPITVMKGQLEGMMYQVGIYKNRDKYLARSYSVACTMEDMVQEILTVSRMEASGFMPQMEEFDLGEMVKECAHKQDDLFIKKDMEVQYHFGSELYAWGDKKLLQKAVNNIISNAIHYSPDGAKIQIEAYKEDGKLTVRVENSGVHLDEEAVPRIFEAFFRVEKSRNRNTGGSGLGLYIVKMILELHKAGYRIENTLTGVAFTFSI